MGLIHIELFATLDLVGQAPGGPDEDPEGFPFGGWQAPLMDEVSGAQISAAPTAGSIERNIISTPQSRTSCQLVVMKTVRPLPSATTSRAHMTTRRMPNRSISAAANGAVSP